MCVIMYAKDVRPTDEMIDRAWDHNKDGGGIAWREGREVLWKKGIMDQAEFKDLINATQIPFIAHFRVASCGGVRPSLTHPFPVGAKASLALSGRTRGGVLFHNGHWNGWQEKAVDAAIHSNTQIPLGNDWSDTRAMAYLVSIYGPGLIDLLPSQRGIIMTPNDYFFFTGPGWYKINDVWCSNDIFWHGRKYQGTQNRHYTGRMCTRARCTNPVIAGEDTCKFCKEEIAREEKPVGLALVKKTEGPSAMSILVGGTDRPLASVLTLKELNQFRNEGNVSKSKYKKFKKLYDTLGQGSHSKQLRVKTALELISEDIAQTIVEQLATRAGSNS
jgi:hypothetical protein